MRTSVFIFLRQILRTNTELQLVTKEELIRMYKFSRKTYVNGRRVFFVVDEATLTRKQVLIFETFCRLKQ